MTKSGTVSPGCKDPASLMSWLSHQTVTAGANDGANSETLSGFRLIHY